MRSDTEKQEVKQMIQSLYRVAAIQPWDGEVNDSVAAVFGVMLFETRKCSAAFKWVPTPPGGKASIAWLVMQLGRGVYEAHGNRLSLACARRVINVWRTDLEMASIRIAMTRLPKCA